MQKLQRVNHHVAFLCRVALAVIVFFGLILLLGCGWINPKPSEAPAAIETPHPILVQPEAPEIVIRRYQPAAIPEWVPPYDPSDPTRTRVNPDASSCLKPEGEDEQRRNMQQEQKIRKTARSWAGAI